MHQIDPAVVLVTRSVAGRADLVTRSGVLVGGGAYGHGQSDRFGPLAHRCLPASGEGRTVVPDNLLELLRRQRGLAAGHQVCDLVPDRHQRRTLYAQPEIDWVTPRVIRHKVVPWSTEQDLMLGILDAGRDGLLWGKFAACRWGFGRFPQLPPHVAVDRRNAVGERLAQVHLLRHIDPRDRTWHDNIPIARPELVVLWLAGMWTHRFGHDIAVDRTAVALDHAWRQRLIEGELVHELADRSGGHGRSGIVVLRRVLENRPPDYQPAGSRLEERFEEIVSWAVRSKLRRQVTVDVGSPIRTVDFKLETWPLVAEINGEAFHTSLTDRTADDERYARFLDLGLSVVVFWEHDIWHDARTVADAMLHLARNRDAVPTLHRPTKAPWEW